jgi:hypothetical protein
MAMQLLEREADIFGPALACSRPLVLRIVRKWGLARVPQLLNEAVVGVAFARKPAS